MNNTAKIIAAIAVGDNAAASQAFDKAIKEKVTTVLDIKKIALTAEIFNKVAAQ